MFEVIKGGKPSDEPSSFGAAHAHKYTKMFIDAANHIIDDMLKNKASVPQAQAAAMTALLASSASIILQGSIGIGEYVNYLRSYHDKLKEEDYKED